jgi:hypothetical protein
MSDIIPVPTLPISNAVTIATIKSEYLTLISTVLTPTKSLAVIGPSTYIDADSYLSSIRSCIKQVTAKLDEEIRPKYEELEQWYVLKRELLQDLTASEQRVKGQMVSYDLDQQKKAREAKRLQDEETRRLSVQAQTEVAKTTDPTLSAVDRARAKFQAKKLVDQASQVQVTLPAPVQVKAASSSFIPTETWKVVDMKAFLRGILDGKIPMDAIQVHNVNVNSFWKINKGNVKGWPGVGVEEGGRIAGR